MVYVLILAAGNSSRMKLNKKKQFITINNKPLFYYSVDNFLKIKSIDKIYINFNKNDLNDITIKKFKNIYKRFINNKRINIIYNGGKERYNSVYNALCEIYSNNIISKNDKILIHDSARPIFNINDTKNLINYLDKNIAITLATKSYDTLKEVKKNKSIEYLKEIKKTLNRDYIYNIKTPQGFNFNILFNAYNKFIKSKSKSITDDIMIIEKFTNYKSFVLNTDNLNIKVTTKDDINFIKKFLKK